MIFPHLQGGSWLPNLYSNPIKNNPTLTQSLPPHHSWPSPSSLPAPSPSVSLSHPGREQESLFCNLFDNFLKVESLMTCGCFFLVCVCFCFFFWVGPECPSLKRLCWNDSMGETQHWKWGPLRSLLSGPGSATASLCEGVSGLSLSWVCFSLTIEGIWVPHLSESLHFCMPVGLLLWQWLQSLSSGFFCFGSSWVWHWMAVLGFHSCEMGK